MKGLKWAMLLIGAALNLANCGALEAGDSTSPNDARPNGTPVYQSQFFGRSGKSASGSALVFISGTAYILRLEGLSVENETGLQIVIYTTTAGGEAARLSLRATTGNQNYTLSNVVTNSVFKSVAIYSPTARTNYAEAQF